MTTADSLYHRQPTAVAITRRDGTQTQIVFATRLEAEAYVALIPLLQMMGEGEVAEVASAVIAPLSISVN